MENTEAHHRDAVHLNYQVSGGKAHSEQLAFSSSMFFFWFLTLRKFVTIFALLLVPLDFQRNLFSPFFFLPSSLSVLQLCTPSFLWTVGSDLQSRLTENWCIQHTIST